MGNKLSHVLNGSSPNAPVPLPPTPPSSPPSPRKQRTDIAEAGRLEGISKNQRKKMDREKRLQERKRARKEQRRFYQAKRKAEKRAEREMYLNSLSAEEREQFKQERLEVMRAERAEERKRRAQIKDVLENHTRYAVCIDLGWNEQMVEKEQRSLARQLSYSYNVLRKCVENGKTPLAMSVTGVDSTIKPVLSFAAQGWETWPIKFSERSLIQYHDKNKLVYLTHDAKEVLHTLDPEMVYVIGGIVDRNRLVGATFSKAMDLKIKTARLNLDTEISIQHGTPVLTVNHCVEILVYAANGMTWKDAYKKVLPFRKGINESHTINGI